MKDLQEQINHLNDEIDELKSYCSRFTDAIQTLLQICDDLRTGHAHESDINKLDKYIIENL